MKIGSIEHINSLIDTHQQLYEYETSGLLADHRTEYMRYLIEMELIELGHSLKGIQHLSKIHKRYE